MSNERSRVNEGLTALAVLLHTLGPAALAALLNAEAIRRLFAEQHEKNEIALDNWRTKRASFVAFLLKVIFAFLADLFLLRPLLKALALTMFSFSAIGLLASFITPVLFIISECIIAVKYERERQWEERFNIRRHSARWRMLGYVVAAIPAAIVVALGFVSSSFVASLGLVAFLGRQVLNFILAIISFVMHILLVHSGMTPREFVDWLLARTEEQRLARRAASATNDASRKRASLLEAAARYEHARLEEQERHGPIAPYPLPESVLALIREELPNFGAVGPKPLPQPPSPGTLPAPALNHRSFRSADRGRRGVRPAPRRSRFRRPIERSSGHRNNEHVTTQPHPTSRFNGCASLRCRRSRTIGARGANGVRPNAVG